MRWWKIDDKRGEILKRVKLRKEITKFRFWSWSQEKERGREEKKRME